MPASEIYSKTVKITHLRCETRTNSLQSAPDEKRLVLLGPLSYLKWLMVIGPNFSSLQFKRWFTKCPHLFKLLEEWTSNCRQFAAVKSWTHSTKGIEKVQSFLWLLFPLWKLRPIPMCIKEGFDDSHFNLAFHWVYRCKAAAKGSKIILDLAKIFCSHRKTPYCFILQLVVLFSCEVLPSSHWI